MFKADYFSSVKDAAIPVRLAARSFIIPVPAGCGQFMTYPEDVPGHPELKKGMPLLNKRGEPKGTGIVFTNYTDGAYQAARDDGKEMIIVNSLSQEQADKLFMFYNDRIPSPAGATEEDIRAVLRHAHEELGINDFFNGDRAKISGFEIERLYPGDAECGIFIRRSPEERFAMLGYGSGTFAGPAGSPQRFDGYVAIVSNAKHDWMVQAVEFLETYRHPDDRRIVLSELPAFQMKEGQSPAFLAEPGL